MVESPPSNYLLRGSCVGETTTQRCYSPTKASPKTPTHPSNGYEVVMEGDLQPEPPVKMSPGRLNFICSNNMQLEVDVTPSFSNHNHDVSPDMPKQSFKALPTNHPLTEDYGDTDAVAVSQDNDPKAFIAVAVSQEDLTDVAAVSQEFGPPSLHNLDTSTIAIENADTPSKAKPRRRRKSKVSSTKATRRRSLRLQSKGLELLTQEKMPQDNKACAASCESGTTNELSNLAEMEDDYVSKPPTRRHSLRIEGNILGFPVQSSNSRSVNTAKKSRIKRKRRSSAGHGAVKKDEVVLSPKKRSCGEKEVRAYSNEKKDDSYILPSPKRLIDEDSTGRKDGIALPPPGSLSIEVKETPVDTPTFEIGMSENGHVKLVQVLEKIAFGVVIGPANFNNVSNRRSKSGRRSRKLGRRSMLESLNSDAKENVVNSSDNKVKPKKRRDTFDLSKKRGLTSAAKRFDDLSIFVDKELSLEDANPDYVTPKAGSTEVNIDAIVKEISRTLDDEPQNGHHHGKDEVAESTELSAVKTNLQNLTSIAIEDKMRQLFPDKMKQVYKYPCVSARIFAAMSIVYEDQANFAFLLPFLVSLVDSEIVSLKNHEDNEPCFINKRVCFSGFDYSSTTTALGEVVGQGGGDLRTSIEALEAILQQALKLSRPIHYLDVAIHCLQCMTSNGNASNACANTMVGYFPSARFKKALKHYLDEMKDVKRFVLSQSTEASDHHTGVRYRLNDFIGRSVRYHLRELLNTLPESVVDFNVDECEERWGRAVDDRSISSILNFSLEKIHELMINQPEIFDYGVQSLPDFFTSEASKLVHSSSMSRDDLNNIEKTSYEDLGMDITEARAFLFAARACKFVLELFRCPGVEEHIDAVGGWASVEAIASTFYNLNIHKGSENEHFAHLREVRDLKYMLEDVDRRFAPKVEHCEFCIRRMRRKFNFKTSSSFVHNLKEHLAGEKGEYFPLVIVMQ